jgi:hypothetical protein
MLIHCSGTAFASLLLFAPLHFAAASALPKKSSIAEKNEELHWFASGDWLEAKHSICEEAKK